MPFVHVQETLGTLVQGTSAGVVAVEVLALIGMLVDEEEEEEV